MEDRGFVTGHNVEISTNTMDDEGNANVVSRPLERVVSTTAGRRCYTGYREDIRSIRAQDALYGAGVRSKVEII